MTTTALERRITAQAFLFDEGSGRDSAELLDLDLGDVLVGGWRQHGQLTESARRTVGVAESEDVVVLATHRVTCSHRPQVDLLVDGVRIHRFEFDLAMAFEVDGLSAVVQSGALVALHGGECQVSGALRVDGATLVERHGSLDARLVVTLHHPVPLVATRQPGADSSLPA
jgi:hypothetical protein